MNSEDRKIKIKTRIEYLEKAYEIIENFEKNSAVVINHNRLSQNFENRLKNVRPENIEIIKLYTNFEMLTREAKIKDLTGIKAIEEAENILKHEIYIVQLHNLKREILYTVKVENNRLSNKQKEEFYVELNRLESKADKEVVSRVVVEVKEAIENTDNIVESLIKGFGEKVKEGLEF